MKLTIDKATLGQNNGKWGIFIEIPTNLLDKLKKMMDKDGDKTVEIKSKRLSRSLDANAALWIMLTKMAAKLRTTKDELYLDMLDRYGVYTHVVVKPEAVKRVMQEWRTVRELGKVTINGKTGIQLQCFYGSSNYDQKEFSILLDGVIEEAKLINIEFISRADRDLMIKEWNV